jgi:hypothetical protein
MTYIICFTQEQLQIINAALSEIPFKHAAPLVQHINSEIQKSIAAAEAGKPDVTYHESLPEMS